MSFVKRYLTLDMALDLGPLAVFFIVHQFWGIMAATGAVMAASVIAVIIGLSIKKRVPVFAVVTLGLVLFLGGASLYFESALFIKLKPTIAKLLFAGGLFIGLWFTPNLLERALGGQVSLTPQGWRVLTWRWMGLAILFAIGNEIMWRTQSTDAWVAFKTALTPVSILCYILVTRLTAPRYWCGDSPDG